MIRDPSDGSVKDLPAKSVREQAGTAPSRLGSASGLPFASTKPEQQARLEKSREWLKQYRSKAKPEGGENDAN